MILMGLRFDLSDAEGARSGHGASILAILEIAGECRLPGTRRRPPTAAA